MHLVIIGQTLSNSVQIACIMGESMLWASVGWYTVPDFRPCKIPNNIGSQFNGFNIYFLI